MPPATPVCNPRGELSKFESRVNARVKFTTTTPSVDDKLQVARDVDVMSLQKGDIHNCAQCLLWSLIHPCLVVCRGFAGMSPWIVQCFACLSLSMLRPYETQRGVPAWR